jgi:hypothetical protein
MPQLIVIPQEDRIILKDVNSNEATNPAAMLSNGKIDFAFYLLRDWLVNTLDAVIDMFGSEKALELLRPCSRFSGASVNDFMIKELGIVGSDVEKISSIVQELNLAMRKDLGPFEVTPFGARCDVHKCLFEDALPEICELICLAAGNGLCSNINSDCRFLIPMKMTSGDPHCRWIITRERADRKRGDYSDTTISVVLRKQVDSEWRDTLGRAAHFALWIQIILVLNEKIGSQRTVEKLGPYLRASGMSAGSHFLQITDAKERNAATIGMILDFLNDGLDQKGVTRRNDSQLVVKEITECPLSGSPPEITLLIEKFTNGICEAVNPDYELVHTEAICRGDTRCVRIIRKKGTKEPVEKEAPETRQEPLEGFVDDPLKVLKMRLARGELTEEEYVRQRKLLLE